MPAIQSQSSAQKGGVSEFSFSALDHWPLHYKPGGAELLLPDEFQRARHQAVFRLDGVILAARPLG